MQDLVANKNDQVIPSTTSVSILCKKLSLLWQKKTHFLA